MPLTRPTITDDSGDGVSGTIFNAAFWATIFDAIDAAFHVLAHDATYNDGSVHGAVPILNRSGRIVITTGGSNVTVIPFWANAGAGVAYKWTFLDPDTGWQISTAGTIAFTDGSSLNTYNVELSGGSGNLNITRTAGSTAYRLQVILDAIVT